MLPADLGDEQRAHLAHEHPNDLDSSPSSPLSGTPTFFGSRRASKSAHQRSPTTADRSRSSHLVARLVSLEQEVREINAATVVTTERLEAETSRANAAEHRALDYFHRLQTATENRERSDQESARLREEVKLYKLQLENAQTEIFRAQEIIDRVASQRNEAEAEAARARTKARKLQEEKLVMLAHKMRYQDGLSMGRRIDYDEEDNEVDVNTPEIDNVTLDEKHYDARSHVQSRSAGSSRQRLIRSESAPPVRTLDTSLHAPPLPVPLRVHTPAREHRTPSPPHDPDEPGPETIHPIPIRPSSIISSQPIGVSIDDRRIPRVDSRTSYIQLSPLHDLSQSTPPSPSSIAPKVRDSRATQQSEPTLVLPSVRSRDYAYQTTVSPIISRGNTPSIVSRTSTRLSQYNLMNKPLGDSLRNGSYIGRARSGSQPFTESTSRNEHHDQDHYHSSRTKSIAEQWRVDDDASSSRNPHRSFTPEAGSNPHQPPRSNYPRPGFHYRAWKLVAPPPLIYDPWLRKRVPTESAAVRSHPLPGDPTTQPTRGRSEIVMPTPLGDADDPRPPRLVSASSTAARSHPSPDVSESPPAHTRPEIVTPTRLGDTDIPQPRRPVRTESIALYSHLLLHDPASLPARTGSPLEHLPQRFRQRRRSLGSSILDIIVESPVSGIPDIESPVSSVPDITVESPSEPETPMSPFATATSLLSPDAANRPLPQNDVHQCQHHPSHSHSQSRSQSPSRHDNRDHLSSLYDAPQRSETPYTPWPVGFVPYSPGHGTTSSSSSSKPGSGPERDHRYTYSPPMPAPAPNCNATSQNGHVLARSQTRSASTSMCRVGVGGTYEAAPLPPGVMYPVPPVRPHMSHRRHVVRDRAKEGERERGREKPRDSPRDWGWDRDRERVRDSDRERRRDSGRDYKRERDRNRDGEDFEDAGLGEERTYSPLSLKAISLFDLDEEE